MKNLHKTNRERAGDKANEADRIQFSKTCVGLPKIIGFGASCKKTKEISKRKNEWTISFKNLLSN